MNNAHTGAELLRASLVRSGLGVLRSQHPTGAWPIYVNHLPNDPDEAVCVYDTPGVKDGRLMAAGTTIRHPGYQIRVRANDHRTGRRKVKEILDHLDGIYRESIVLEDDTYTLNSVTQTTDVLPLGQEPDGGRRESWTMNGTLTFTTA